MYPNKPIKIKFAGETKTYRPRGIGAYPYDCRAKDRFPKSMIYENKSGGWVPSHDLKKREDGTYLLVWGNSDER